MIAARDVSVMVATWIAKGSQMVSNGFLCGIIQGEQGEGDSSDR